ncbi:nitroreductase [Stachybotrys elegans]|uniref:Nitroreductase n=1 Tax=Stachybotrys elegans TaxID=80388 RepID=A0A8K0SYS8_9HYPO|nr:nitroreductase [Stachybotrys elegans]
MASSSTDTLLQVVKSRRTHYGLTKETPIPSSRIEEIVKHALLHVPSSFNSQTTRVVVLFGGEHDKLWDIVTGVLKAKIPEAKWEPTGKKMAMFKGAAGTILFFEDQKVVNSFQEKFPSYSKNFDPWATQSDGMLQYTLWLALDSEGLGCNLQHYNPIIDEKVAAEWSVPDNWKLNAQLVFGGRTSEPGEKAFMPIEERYKAVGQ